MTNDSGARRVRAIFFDLDNCLSAADEAGPVLEPLFEAIRRANDGRYTPEQIAAIIADCWRSPLDYVSAKHGFPESMREAAWAASAAIELPRPMRGYPDLPVLAELPVMRFLVTSGFRRLQTGKIRSMGIGPLFTEIVIDVMDEPVRRGKRGVFEYLMARHGLAPDEVLVVGDNPDSEIEAGNSLGITTVQTLRPGVARGDNAKHHIRGLEELKPLLGLPVR